MLYFWMYPDVGLHPEVLRIYEKSLGVYWGLDAGMAEKMLKGLSAQFLIVRRALSLHNLQFRLCGIIQ